MIDMADTYMCRRCGAVIANTAATLHGDWHSRLAASIEDAALNPDSIVSPGGHEWSLRLPVVVDITPDPMLAACVCDLIETTADPEYPSYVRGKSNGCLRHPSERDQRDAAARRKARE
jgi:hypothetical protein